MEYATNLEDRKGVKHLTFLDESWFARTTSITFMTHFLICTFTVLLPARMSFFQRVGTRSPLSHDVTCAHTDSYITHLATFTPRSPFWNKKLFDIYCKLAGFGVQYGKKLPVVVPTCPSLQVQFGQRSIFPRIEGAA